MLRSAQIFWIKLCHFYVHLSCISLISLWTLLSSGISFCKRVTTIKVMNRSAIHYQQWNNLNFTKWRMVVKCSTHLNWEIFVTASENNELLEQESVLPKNLTCRKMNMFLMKVLAGLKKPNFLHSKTLHPWTSYPQNTQYLRNLCSWCWLCMDSCKQWTATK